MIKELDDYDWKAAFTYANFEIEDVIEIITMDDGENDTSPWIGIFKLKNGLYGYLEAGCDYTGWDCQAGGRSEEDESLDNLIRMKMSKTSRVRLGKQIPEDFLTN